MQTVAAITNATKIAGFKTMNSITKWLAALAEKQKPSKGYDSGSTWPH
jgi:hypothetical protein